jgi:hypothetical protein
LFSILLDSGKYSASIMLKRADRVHQSRANAGTAPVHGIVIR